MLNALSLSRPHVLYSFISANHFWEMYSSAFNNHIIFLPSVLVSTLFQPLSVFPPDPRPSPLWLQLVSEEVHPPSAPPAVSSHPLPDLQASHSQSSSSSLSTEAQRCLDMPYSAPFSSCPLMLINVSSWRASIDYYYKTIFNSKFKYCLH